MALAISLGGSGHRRWDDLQHDVLATIFSKVDLPDLIVSVPLVCSNWHEVTSDPICWREVDFRHWNSISLRLGLQRHEYADFLDLFDFAIDFAGGYFVSVRFPPFADRNDLLYLANKCPKLLYFYIEDAGIPEDQFCDAISSLKNLKGMAISENLIRRNVLGHVHDCCKSFSELEVFANVLDEKMASVICDCLPNLHKLEILNCATSQRGVVILLDRLKELEYLDISGHENDGKTDFVLEKASRLKVFRWDSRFDEGEYEYCSLCENDYRFQDPCECVLDEKIMEWHATHPGYIECDSFEPAEFELLDQQFMECDATDSDYSDDDGWILSER